MTRVFLRTLGVFLGLAMILSVLPQPGHAAPLSAIAAVVNGEMITSFDLQAEVSSELGRLGIDPRNPANQTKVNELTKRVLDNLINNIILTQEAERLSINVADADVENELRQFMEQNRLTPAEFQRQLQLQGFTEKSFKSRIRNSILRKRLLATMVGRKVVVTKDEVVAYYGEHKSMFKSNQNVRFSVLVYPPTADAEKFSARIKSGAVTFESVVREVSVGPKAKEGGDLGTLAWDGLDPSWRNRLSSLKTGQVSDLFEINGLKTQIKLTEMAAGEEQSLEQASEQIENILREPKLQERLEEYNKQLRNRAMIDIRL